ncbi:hypothetical protein SAMN02746068_02223 [Lactococcus chungangensis CAU 28 = DSM 22330]|uniref:Uncharacterized protein n=1 Tax=Pseudolactococcus chungangensis CAU 28 = DSM 22330 TaxID=1122154 RepID=A0A1K2HKB5_9LACT|nr:hypothetical protein [Lactococcus chungangensis]SFZ77264.1 hypothetical protein SAMN02746068_02223 [Lactococcus chungangensis CAU 28 = DSM 22330]
MENENGNFGIRIVEKPTFLDIEIKMNVLFGMKQKKKEIKNMMKCLKI